MSQPLTGSRYELYVARKGAPESKAAHDYFAIHPGDVEEVEEGDDVDRLRALGGAGQHRRRSGPALRRLSDRLPAALPVLPQPGHLAQAQRQAGDASRRRCR